METNVLGQFLRSICDNSDWKYAVFWKRKYRQNQTMLLWEDGYCDNLKPKKSFRNDNVTHPQKHFSPGGGISRHTSKECPVRLALSEMASVQYVIGEGLVGKVAYSGTHYWTSSKDILAFEHFLPIHELPNEWLPQIVAGIKTIVLVAVAPYGVLQLGSFEVVAEEMGLLSRIIREFNAIQNQFRMFSSSNRNSVAQSMLPLESILPENSDDSTIVTATFLSDVYSEEIDEISELLSPLTPSMKNINPQFTIADIFQEFDDAFLSCPRDLYGEDTAIPFSTTSAIKEEELEINQQLYNPSVGIFDDRSAGIISSHIFEDNLENIYEPADGFGISSAYELGEAQSMLLQQNFDYNWETLMPDNDAFTGDTKLYVQETNECFRQISDAGDLLGAVVSSAYNQIDKALNNRNNCSELIPQVATEPASAFLLDYTGLDSLCSQTTSVEASGSRGSSSKFSSTTTTDSMKEELIHSHLTNEGYADKKSARGSKPLLRKTRDKAIDKQKRRPRDRQLIQDRLKVLRDLVPNGGKFSIDGLLERTIKHMMFLRKVSEQSRKLRAYLEMDGEIKLKSSQVKDISKSGASWAYQADGVHEVFPIVVEDLDIPGHMLIEMLCNDHDLFLEVAQVICGLDLTIVKGGMKTRSSSSWAQFVVEVHNGFQRMDVFWPLMQLIQRNPNSGGTRGGRRGAGAPARKIFFFFIRYNLL